jgi:hypothetical protein
LGNSIKALTRFELEIFGKEQLIEIVLILTEQVEALQLRVASGKKNSLTQYHETDIPERTTDGLPSRRRGIIPDRCQLLYLVHVPGAYSKNSRLIWKIIIDTLKACNC